MLWAYGVTILLINKPTFITLQSLCVFHFACVECAMRLKRTDVHLKILERGIEKFQKGAESAIRKNERVR